MEWVETTAATIDEARLRALDTLGVAFDDAEIEVIAEPKKGVFGIGKADARVRARVRPVEPRAKVERRDRNRKRGNDRGSNRQDNQQRGNNRGKGQNKERSSGGQNQSGKGRNDKRDNKGGRGNSGGGTKAENRNRGGNGNGRGRGHSQGGQSPKGPDQGSKQQLSNQKDNKAAATASSQEQKSMEDTPLIDGAGQAAIVEEFMDGLLGAFVATGEIESVEVDTDTYEVRVNGNDLGLMIGPKGATMQAIQEVARTAVQQQADGSMSGRVHLDVGGYRAKRREALADFTRRVADSVKESGTRKVLEPMPAPDRKVIHDTVAEIDGVQTSSEGEDRRRHIVLSPAD